MVRKFFLCAIVLLGFNGCVVGLVYEDITVPLDRDMQRTTFEHPAVGTSSLFRLREPISGASASVEWAGVGLGSAATDCLEVVEGADMRKQSAAFRIWRRDTLVAYGSATEEPRSSKCAVALPHL